MATMIDTKICDICGKTVDPPGGKTCELGHFTCRSCVMGGPSPQPRKYCLLCHTTMQ